MLPCERCWACRRYLRFRQADRGGHSQDAERSHPRTGLILSCSSWASGAVLVLQHVRRLWSFCHAVAAVGPQVLTGSFRRYSNSSTDQVDRSPPHWGCESRGDPITCGVSRPARQFGGQGATSQIEDRTRPGVRVRSLRLCTECIRPETEPAAQRAPTRTRTATSPQ
jgi:hypothetical protein